MRKQSYLLFYILSAILDHAWTTQYILKLVIYFQPFFHYVNQTLYRNIRCLTINELPFC